MPSGSGYMIKCALEGPRTMPHGTCLDLQHFLPTQRFLPLWLEDLAVMPLTERGNITGRKHHFVGLQPIPRYREVGAEGSLKKDGKEPNKLSSLKNFFHYFIFFIKFFI